MKDDALEKALPVAREHLMFSALDDEQFARLSARSRLITLQPGEQLFMQGDEAERFYFVYSGCVKLFRLSFCGQEKIVEVINRRETMAEAIMFMERTSYPVNAEAVESSQLIAFSNAIYKQLLTESSHCCFKVMAAMACRLHTRMSEIETLTMQNARHRVGQFLLGLANGMEEGQVAVRLPVTKRLIAARLAMQPETLSRIMHDFKQRGLLEINGRQLLINDVNGLREMI